MKLLKAVFWIWKEKKNKWKNILELIIHMYCMLEIISYLYLWYCQYKKKNETYHPCPESSGLQS